MEMATLLRDYHVALPDWTCELVVTVHLVRG